MIGALRQRLLRNPSDCLTTPTIRGDLTADKRFRAKALHPNFLTEASFIRNMLYEIPSGA